MSEESKYEYSCPRCRAGLKSDPGYCPECGFIGRLEHRVLRLTAMTAAGKLVLSEPPFQITQKKRGEPLDARNGPLQYKCPRCGTRTSKAFGRCPDGRSCGYVGPMQGVSAQG